MRSPEKFATSLVSLALVRNGYITYKDVPCGLHERMRFLDEDISLEVISGESIASGLQV